MMRRAQPQRGFTLLEVLVALAIIAIVLLAALRASAAVLDASARSRLSLLAQQCAENSLIELRLGRLDPQLGPSSQRCSQGGASFTVDTLLQATPNPALRRIDLQVLDPSGWAAWHVVAIVARPQ